MRVSERVGKSLVENGHLGTGDVRHCSDWAFRDRFDQRFGQVAREDGRRGRSSRFPNGSFLMRMFLNVLHTR